MIGIKTQVRTSPVVALSMNIYGKDKSSIALSPLAKCNSLLLLSLYVFRVDGTFLQVSLSLEIIPSLFIMPQVEENLSSRAALSKNEGGGKLADVSWKIVVDYSL